MKDKILLPNFYGIFEVKSATKNRIRIEIDKLKNNEEEIERLKENLKKIIVIKSFKIIKSIGSWWYSNWYSIYDRYNFKIVKLRWRAFKR